LVGGSDDQLDRSVRDTRVRLLVHAIAQRSQLTRTDSDLLYRIALLVESIKDDRRRTNELFQYVWTLICVRRGLMRVIRVVHGETSRQLIVEEIQTGRLRIVASPPELDAEVEGLAVQALARILNDARPWDRQRASL
jgi:hypothetical protein